MNSTSGVNDACIAGNAGNEWCTHPALRDTFTPGLLL
jgi:hypothetical protein